MTGAAREAGMENAKAVSSHMQAMLRTLDGALDQNLRALAAITVNEMEDQLWKLSNAVFDWLEEKDSKP